MIEYLMSRSFPGDHQGGAAGFIRLHVRGLHSLGYPFDISRSVGSYQ